MSTTALPRTTHRSAISLTIGLLVAAVLVAALLIARASSSGSSKPTEPVLGSGSGSTPAHAVSAGGNEDSGCFAYRLHSHVC
jgi:hypothetical protein